MAFSEQFLDELRARTGLADVISRRVKLAKKGQAVGERDLMIGATAMAAGARPINERE